MSSQFSISGEEAFYTTVLELASEKSEAGFCTLISKLNIQTCRENSPALLLPANVKTALKELAPADGVVIILQSSKELALLSPLKK